MFGKLIDISKLIYEGMPVYPGDPPYEVHRQSALAQGDVCNLSSFTMSMHCGTHVDAPLHFSDNGTDIAELELERFCGSAKVFEFDSKTAVDVADLSGLSIGAGDRILIKIPANELLTQPPGFYSGSIGLTAAAADYLAARKVALVGINGDSVDNESDHTYPVHQILLAAGIPIVEDLCLAAVAPGEYYLVCLPLKLDGGNGAPARAVLAALEKGAQK